MRRSPPCPRRGNAGRVALVLGAGGLGKSRLLAEIGRAIRRPCRRSRTGRRCDGTVFAARALAARRRRAIRLGAGRGAAGSARGGVAGASVAGQPRPRSRPRRSAPTASGYWAKRCASGLTACILDDLHCADAASLELFSRLMLADDEPDTAAGRSRAGRGKAMTRRRISPVRSPTSIDSPWSSSRRSTKRISPRWWTRWRCPTSRGSAWPGRSRAIPAAIPCSCSRRCDRRSSATGWTAGACRGRSESSNRSNGAWRDCRHRRSRSCNSPRWPARSSRCGSPKRCSEPMRSRWRKRGASSNQRS